MSNEQGLCTLLLHREPGQREEYFSLNKEIITHVPEEKTPRFNLHFI